METLWKNICNEGLYGPVILRVGINNKKFRLEFGNHRIQVFAKYGVDYTPTTIQVQEKCGPYVDNVMTNASHNFDFTDDVILLKLTKGYMKPSSVFKSLFLQVKSF